MNILVDAMGGDNAPEMIVLGCVEAVKAKTGFDISLYGDSKQIQRILEDNEGISERIKIVHCEEVISSDDTPTQAIKMKKDSSMVRSLVDHKENQGHAVISAGNSGALLAGSLLITGRIDGVIRPALGAIIPSGDKFCLLIDAGLNSTLRPESYVQFAHFGSEYMKVMTDCKNPSVGLLNIGTEENKGKAETKEAYELLQKSSINFYGNVEGHAIAQGTVDVIVSDGFTGNVCLKVLEGTANYIFTNIKSIFNAGLINKIAALILKKDFLAFKKTIDPDTMGGAPILGVNGLIIKSHGNSNSKTIKNVVLKTVYLLENQIVDKIKRVVAPAI